ncbi:MAG: ABC transporter permease, partial [Burkholderiales bacterium]
MNTDYINLSNGQLAFAAVLILVNVAISVWLRLGLAKTLLVASTRMVVQLLLVGFILQSVFELKTPLPVIGIGLVMSALAGIAAVQRTHRRFAGVYWDSMISVLGSAFVVTGAAVVGILDVSPWYEPQYTIPLLGMVLGNILSGISLALDRFMEGVARDASLIESDLALGASRWEAAHTLTENQMTVREIFAGGKLFAVTGGGYEPKGEITLDGARAHIPDHPALAECLRAGALCNDAQLGRDAGGHPKVQGDPTEAALLVAAEKGGLPPVELLKNSPRVDMIPFASEHMFRATLHEAP